MSASATVVAEAALATPLPFASATAVALSSPSRRPPLLGFWGSAPNCCARGVGLVAVSLS